MPQIAENRPSIRDLTNSTGGVVSATDTVVDVPAAYAEATLAAQLATLTAKINEILTVLRGRGIIG